MNREIKQMLKLSISIVLIELVFVNLGGIFNQPPTELKTSYASWRVHTNRLRTLQIDQSSEKGAYPRLSSRHLTMAAFPKQNKIYILNSKKVVYILNAESTLLPDNISFWLAILEVHRSFITILMAKTLSPSIG